MNLLYILNESYYSPTDEKQYLLNSKYDIKFFESEMKLCIKPNSDHIDGFWGENIFDVMAIVGENGSGKTKLANCIMDTLTQLNVLDASGFGLQFIIIFENEIENKTAIKIFVTEKFKNIVIDSTFKCRLHHYFECKEIERFKFGYFTNILSLNDYRHSKYGVNFDASLGGGIWKSFKHNFEMHYILEHKDKIFNYYEDETKKMSDFITSDLSRVRIPFVLPENVTVSVNDYHENLRYISKELDEMGNKKEEILYFKKDGRYILEDKCTYILKNYDNNGCRHLLINLMLNLFKDLCIPQTSADKLEKKALKFLNKIMNLNDTTDNNIFSMMQKLFYSIRNSKNADQVDYYINFIKWLSEISAFQDDPLDLSRKKWVLNLSKNKTLINQLLSHYNNTSFAFPYLTFDFGLSSGEFNFLLLFSKIAELLHKDREGNYCVINNLTRETKCENLFLYFDEADLSLHPKWQQQYLDWLLLFINSHFKNCTVQIAIASHSPIMLSDFPQNNVLYLWKDKEKNTYAGKREVKTFGNNIHTLFLDSFFLDEVGTMGAFAEKKINKIANNLKNNMSINYKNDLKIIENIGDDLIRNKLLQMYNRKASPKKEPSPLMPPDDSIIDTTIRLIKKQIRNLQNTLEELEKMKSDKD